MGCDAVVGMGSVADRGDSLPKGEARFVFARSTAPQRVSQT